VPVTSYRDGFGNWCTRILAPKGRLRLSATAIVSDTGAPDPFAVSEHQHAVEDLPEESLVFLLGSRYCETDRLTGIAWDLFGQSPTGHAASRPSATTSITTSPSTIRMRDRRERRGSSRGRQRRVPRLRASGDSHSADA
jgi:hypothetical protein